MGILLAERLGLGRSEWRSVLCTGTTRRLAADGVVAVEVVVEAVEAVVVVVPGVVARGLLIKLDCVGLL